MGINLSVEVPSSPCYQGQALLVGLEIKDAKADDAFSLSTILLAGAAQISMDDSSLALNGEWTKLPAHKLTLAITPQQQGELMISFQVRSTAGSTLSHLITLQRVVLAGTTMSTEVTYDSPVINPGLETLVPLRLCTTKPHYTGEYTISTKLLSGKGILYYNGFIVNDAEFRAGSEAILQYHPKELGDHLLEFSIAAQGESTSVKAYLDVYNSLAVQCDAPCGVTVSGIGEYTEQGEDVVLRLVNDDGFNYSVAGWYGAKDELLTAEQEYKQKMSIGCNTNITLKLKQRNVAIVKNGERDEETRYVEIVNGKPTVKYCYRGLTSLSADYRLSDELVFYYQRAQYNMGTIPPTPQWWYVTVDFKPAENWLGYFYRIGGGEFRIYLRKADNPSFRFTGRYAEKGATRYYISSPIIIQ